MPQQVKLPDKFITMLSNLPESGMGYQLVDITLKDGRTLSQRKVLNAEFLLLQENENIQPKDITEIVLSQPPS